MFELSESEAADQAGGALPSPERQAFLYSIVSALRSARVLVFHGRWNEVDWDAIRVPLATSFLAVEDPTWVMAPGEDYRYAESGDATKAVVLMQSPTRWGRTNDFIDDVGTLVGRYCDAP
jgi:hypothetical protein